MQSVYRYVKKSWLKMAIERMIFVLKGRFEVPGQSAALMGSDMGWRGKERWEGEREGNIEGKEEKKRGVVRGEQRKGGTTNRRKRRRKEDLFFCAECKLRRLHGAQQKIANACAQVIKHYLTMPDFTSSILLSLHMMKKEKKKDKHGSLA